MTAPFLAVDWGTTNRRVFLIEDGKVVRTERDDHGVTAVAKGGFEQEVADIRARFGDLPMLLAGMVGANIGWRVAPYVPAPAGIDELVAGLLRIDDRTAIVPGISSLRDGRADIMRGEETQFVGALASGLAPRDALLAQPGTHCKWAEIQNGRVMQFVTAMTGELFSLLRKHGLLAAQLGAEVTLGDAFRAGLVEGRKRDLAASLFGIRASFMLGQRDDVDAASYASGLLIGSDVAARMAETSHEIVHVLADPVLGGLYVAAIEANGRTARLVDSHSAFVAGIIAIGEMM
ncbi:2-dehydro-3-deoxygalactonokinase [Sphingomonas endolithica]|uniref:2-dehydro-3-deoxygalactonokinase n=1 Tax=Sphingomonas endolithica TaxID=2972485 RepID=UPI0021AFE888|nr:2-dehydro-3-deoxygalactonokinase [Sphingomonas sp. ZFBP2030]